MKADIRIADDVLDVLKRSVVEGNILKLPPGQLDRKLYVRVDEALGALGGKWNRHKKGHVFDTDPRAAIAAASDSGKVAHPNALSFFATSPEIAEDVAERLQIRRGMRFLEPSAGDGALVAPVIRRLGGVPGPALVTLVELDEGRCTSLRERGYAAYLVPGDFLACTADRLGLSDRIAMNPPFEKEADARHIGHALDFLAPGGRLVAIASSGFKFRSTRRLTKTVRERVLSWGGTIEDLPQDAFKHAGVTVLTVLVTVERPRDSA